MAKLSDALQSLTEADLTRDVVIPLFASLYGSVVEYTHGPVEQGRDLVCIRQDELEEITVVCVQVKAHRISAGVTSGPASIHAIAQQAMAAKSQGVTLESGSSAPVDTVFIVSPFPFPESDRRQVSDLLGRLRESGCRIIAGDRLEHLLRTHCPRIAAKLLQYADPALVTFLSQISYHTEARAFDLARDRPLSDFYVPLCVWPPPTAAFHAVLTDFGYAGKSSYSPRLEVTPAEFAAIVDSFTSPRKASKGLRTVTRALQKRDPFIRKWKPGLVSAEIREDTVPKTMEAEGSTHITPAVQLDLGQPLHHLKQAVASAWDACPRVLGPRGSGLRMLLKRLAALDEFFVDVAAAIGPHAVPATDLGALGFEDPPYSVQVNEVQHLLGLARHLLVDGPPGLGKTTLLKTLAVYLVEREEAVVFVPCCRIEPADVGRGLMEIARERALNPLDSSVKPSDAVLMVDGLDEAPFDLGPHLLTEAAAFRAVIATCRPTFATALRSKALVVSLAPYSRSQRDSFFERWFSDSPARASDAQGLIADHPDLDRHTRMPMVATLLAALVERGRQPRNRCEIYDGRLDLLLHRWDAARGVRRIRVPDPQLKLRFLKHLAYYVHKTLHQRFFTESVLNEVFEWAVGLTGYQVQFDGLMHDLLVASCLIVEDTPGSYSFGHLTFQEHLVGLYLADFATPKEILDLCSDYWWLEPIRFYGAKRGEITDLVFLAAEAQRLTFLAPTLSRLLLEAPYTSEKASWMVTTAGKIGRTMGI